MKETKKTIPKRWPKQCRRCGKHFMSAKSTAVKYCSIICATRDWRARKQFEAWKLTLTGTTGKQLLKEYEKANAQD